MLKGRSEDLPDVPTTTNSPVAGRNLGPISHARALIGGLIVVSGCAGVPEAVGPDPVHGRTHVQKEMPSATVNSPEPEKQNAPQPQRFASEQTQSRDEAPGTYAHETKSSTRSVNGSAERFVLTKSVQDGYGRYTINGQPVTKRQYDDMHQQLDARQASDEKARKEKEKGEKESEKRIKRLSLKLRILLKECRGRTEKDLREKIYLLGLLLEEAKSESDCFDLQSLIDEINWASDSAESDLRWMKD